VRDRQRLLALERANRVRVAQAELKRQLRSGEMAAAEVVLRCPRDAETMTVGAVLVSQPGWGPTRCATLLRALCLSDRKTLGALTERQRVMLAAVLGRDADHPQSGARR
jgi:hypothetical protein